MSEISERINALDMPDNLKAMLIESGLEVCSLCIMRWDGKITSYVVGVPLRGNKAAIDKLIAQGWEKGSRQKWWFNGDVARKQFAEYRYLLDLSYPVA